MATSTARLFKEIKKQRLPPLPSVPELIKIYQLSAIKQLSQNFLMDDKLTSKIAKVAGNLEGCAVCEVGPGPGSITRSILMRNPHKVILIEKDKRFDKSLKLLQNACPGKIDVYWGDVMSFDMSKMFPTELSKPWNDERLPKLHIVGNLPFNISTPLIFRWFSKMSKAESAWANGRVPMTLTFQKEVAQRMVSQVGDEQRSRLSIMAQYLTECSLKFIIRGSAFVPKPDVDVGVVRFIPRIKPLIEQPYGLVEKVVRHAFCMRGKYCCKPISTLFPNKIRLHFTKMLFEISLVFPNTRPYGLTMEDFERLCNAYAEIISKYPEIWDYEHRAAKAEEIWQRANAAKYQPFESETEKDRPAQISPFSVIPDDLQGDLAEALEAEEILQEEDDMYFDSLRRK